MKCIIFNHEWSHWEPSSSGRDKIQIKICKKCGKIKSSEWLHGINYSPMSDLRDITDKYFESAKETK